MTQEEKVSEVENTNEEKRTLLEWKIVTKWTFQHDTCEVKSPKYNNVCDILHDDDYDENVEEEIEEKKNAKSTPCNAWINKGIEISKNKSTNENEIENENKKEYQCKAQTKLTNNSNMNQKNEVLCE